MYVTRLTYVLLVGCLSHTCEDTRQTDPRQTDPRQTDPSSTLEDIAEVDLAPQQQEEAAPSVAPPSQMPGDIQCKRASNSPIGWRCDEHRDKIAEKYYRFAWDAFVYPHTSHAKNETGGKFYWSAWKQITYPNLPSVCTNCRGCPTQPLWDANGNRIEIETRVSKQTTNSIVGNPPSPGAEIDASCEERTRILSWGQHNVYKEGPYHFKFAWKTLTQSDCDNGHEFILRKNSSELGCVVGDQGAVAVHIATKTQTTTFDWLWATFSHSNNIEGDQPFFARCTNDEECNVCPTRGGDGKYRTKLRREVEIAPEVERFNEKYTSMLSKHSEIAALAQYQLIGIQYATLDHKRTRTPEVLSNEVLEWDRQETDCIGCHRQATVLVYVPGLHDEVNHHPNTCSKDECKSNGVHVCGTENCKCARRDWFNEDRTMNMADMFFSLKYLFESQ
jgi:hypothetical protein